MKITGQYRTIVLFIGLIFACTAIAEAGKVDFTPSDDVMPMGYEGITSFNAASPNSSGTSTIWGAPSSTSQSWNMPTPMPVGQPMESVVTVDTTNEDGILSADITIDSTLDGPISGDGTTKISPEFDTTDFSFSMGESYSDVEGGFKTVDMDKLKNYDIIDEFGKGTPQNTEDWKQMKQPDKPEKVENVYSHEIGKVPGDDTSSSSSYGGYNYNTSGGGSGGSGAYDGYNYEGYNFENYEYGGGDETGTGTGGGGEITEPEEPEPEPRDFKKEWEDSGQSKPDHMREY